MADRKTAKIKYVGPDRTGHVVGDVEDRRPVPHGTVGTMIVRDKGILIETVIDGETVRFWAPSWELRRFKRAPSD